VRKPMSCRPVREQGRDHRRSEIIRGHEGLTAVNANRDIPPARRSGGAGPRARRRRQNRCQVSGPDGGPVAGAPPGAVTLQRRRGLGQVAEGLRARQGRDPCLAGPRRHGSGTGPSPGWAKLRRDRDRKIKQSAPAPCYPNVLSFRLRHFFRLFPGSLSSEKPGPDPVALIHR